MLSNSTLISQRISPPRKILTSLVFIDPSVSDYQTLLAGVVEGVTAIALHPNQDGIAQITEVLQQYQHITTIHIVSHGAPGCLYLGNSQLNLDNLSNYAELLQRWHSTNILLYGCNVAEGDAGEEFIRKLHEFTNATISASATKTGNAALGGDWNLEVSFPANKRTSLGFCAETLATYPGVLTSPLATILTTVYGQLTAFAGLEGFWASFAEAFGTEYNPVLAESFRAQWQVGDFSKFPEVEVISSSILGNANGAYASSTNKIYLSDSC